jgi:hypothetical protein
MSTRRLPWRTPCILGPIRVRLAVREDPRGRSCKGLRPVRDSARKGWPLAGQLWKWAHGTHLAFRGAYDVLAVLDKEVRRPRLRGDSVRVVCRLDTPAPASARYSGCDCIVWLSCSLLHTISRGCLMAKSRPRYTMHRGRLRQNFRVHLVEPQCLHWPRLLTRCCLSNVIALASNRTVWSLRISCSIGS